MPEALYDVVWKEVEKKIIDIRYARVIMTLSEILEGSFFNTYIKQGDRFLECLVCSYHTLVVSPSYSSLCAFHG